MPWSDHFVLRAQLGFPPPDPHLGSDKIYAQPIGFQAAVRDPNPASSLLKELVEDWNSCLSNSIDTIAPQQPLHSRAGPASWYTLELWKELRWLEKVWRHTQDESARTFLRSYMKTYDVAMKPPKNDFYAETIASACWHPDALGWFGHCASTEQPKR